MKTLNHKPAPLLISMAILLLALGAQSAGQTHAVAIQDMRFNPAVLKIKTGETVTWTNADDRDHTVIATDGSFTSGNISTGQSFQHKFTTPGTFSYFCKYHPRMKGTIIVSAK